LQNAGTANNLKKTKMHNLIINNLSKLKKQTENLKVEKNIAKAIAIVAKTEIIPTNNCNGRW
jgi:hypothetical protein